LRAAAVHQDVELDESRVVAAAVGGDERAFRTLVELHYDGCLRYAMRMLHNRSDAEDVVQETFVRVYRGLGSYREQGRFRGWLYRILVNQCRSANGNAGHKAVLVSADDAPESDLVSASGPALSDIELALASLAPLLREAFILKFVEGWSYEEMKKLTGASESALKMRVARAKDALREQLRGGTQ
jgi:RNA polymerase sigma-70 factor (ECF subfamily)